MSNANDCDPSDWEDSFMVLEPGDSLFGPAPPEYVWAVMEAECAVVCYCATREGAQAIADALNEAWAKKYP